MWRLPMAEKSRNYGIDLLRMTCMYMVVILHICGQGGILEAAEGTQNGAVAWFIRILAYCAVNCYGLISGYVGIDAKYKYSNLIVLWLHVIFYTVVITVCFAFAMPGSVGKGEVLNAVFPVMRKQYWYFTAYFCMFFFIPAFNLVVDSMPPKQLKALVIALFVLFSLLPTLFHSDVFGVNGGYSALWLGVLYLFGAYIKRNGPVPGARAEKYAVLYLLCVVLTWGFRMVIGSYLDIYTSPTMVAAAVCLLILFAGINTTPVIRKMIMIFAPLSFGVYLVHTHPLIWSYVMKNRFAEYAALTSVQLVFAVFAAALMIYLVCSLTDMVRSFIYRLLKIEETADRIERRIRENVKLPGRE